MTIKPISDKAFEIYGRVLILSHEPGDLISALEKKEAPEDRVIYIPSDKTFEALPIAEEIKNSFFGELPIQIGYCNGTNNKLNALEYHRSSEVCVAATDLVLLVGKQQDITPDFTYDTSLIEAFLVTKGQVFEMYATTLHYAPCSIDGKPFRNIVALPQYTNTERITKLEMTKEDKLLVAKNKWLIAHEEAAIEGAFNGLIGENISI